MKSLQRITSCVKVNYTLVPHLTLMYPPSEVCRPGTLPKTIVSMSPASVQALLLLGVQAKERIQECQWQSRGTSVTDRSRPSKVPGRNEKITYLLSAMEISADISRGRYRLSAGSQALACTASCRPDAPPSSEQTCIERQS